MIVGGLLQNSIGCKNTIRFGGTVIMLAMLSCYWAVNNFVTFCLLFGLILGIGLGLTYSAPLTAGIFAVLCSWMIIRYEMVSEQSWFCEWQYSSGSLFWFGHVELLGNIHH